MRVGATATVTTQAPKFALVDGPSYPGSAKMWAPLRPSRDPHIQRTMTLHCSQCRQPFNGPRVVKGAKHKGCLASPRGRMGERPLSERPLPRDKK